MSSLIVKKSVVPPQWAARPARRQISADEASRLERSLGLSNSAVSSGAYNVWYDAGADSFDRSARNHALSSAQLLGPGGVENRTRCEPWTDCGATSAPESGVICLQFARGICAAGPDCKYRHALPDPDVPPSDAVDCFGRSRHATDNADMSGVGSFLRNSRTLYFVGMDRTLGSGKSLAELELIFHQVASRFGDLEYVRVIPDKRVAFARFAHRGVAEFAREALNDKWLEDREEAITVKWAMEDPNPKARAYEERQRDLAIAATLAAGKKRKRVGPAVPTSRAAIAAPPAATSDATADEVKPAAEVKEAVYNPFQGVYYAPNPETKEAHPYAYGAYNKKLTNLQASMAKDKPKK